MRSSRCHVEGSLRCLSLLSVRLLVALLASRYLLPGGFGVEPAAHIWRVALQLLIGTEEGRYLRLPVLR
jgi:hypothetical protein